MGRQITVLIVVTQYVTDSEALLAGYARDRKVDK